MSQRFFGIAPFRFYALADEIRRILSQGHFHSAGNIAASLQPELALDRES